MTRSKANKLALCFSLILLLIWSLMGATSSIAWFEAEDTIVNSLYFGDLGVELYYKDGDTYKKVDAVTKIFSDDDLYEPGYTHVTYLKVKNTGSIAFDYDLSVIPDMTSTVLGTSVTGSSIDLADYIKFGFVTGDTEAEVEGKIPDRDGARAYAVHKLSEYSEDGGNLQTGEEGFAALIVYLPETVGNEANYTGDTAPSVTLGIAAIANQSAN